MRLGWSVLAKIRRTKDAAYLLRITSEQKKALEALAIEMRLDINELLEVGIVTVYELLGQGYTAKHRAISQDPAIWQEIGTKAKDRCEAERKAIRGNCK